MPFTHYASEHRPTFLKHSCSPCSPTPSRLNTRPGIDLSGPLRRSQVLRIVRSHRAGVEASPFTQKRRTRCSRLALYPSPAKSKLDLHILQRTFRRTLASRLRVPHPQRQLPSPPPLAPEALHQLRIFEPHAPLLQPHTGVLGHTPRVPPHVHSGI